MADEPGRETPPADTEPTHTESQREPEDGEPTEGEQSDAVLPVTVGTALWAVALVVLLPFQSRMRAAGTGWWISVCVTGLVLGLLGSAWVRRRRAAYRRAGRSRPGS